MNRYTHLNITRNRFRRRYYRKAKYPTIGHSTSDIYIVTDIGDRLDTLAHHFYNDSQLWWVISIANPDIIRRDSYFLKPGIQIRIPQNIDRIIDSFERLNS